MNSLDDYVRAATRDNTRKSYRSAVEHFEASWGGFLPATPDSVARYLAHYAPTLSVRTLRQRLAALAAWHAQQGFPDPTKAPLVKQVLKGIGELHPCVEKQAKPLQLAELDKLVRWLEDAIGQAAASNDRRHLLTYTRNRALILIGFWRAFRSDELTRLCAENIQVLPGRGLEIFLHRSKADRTSEGRLYRTPALKRLCPVDAYQDWTHRAGITQGPVFRAINRWGQVADQALHSISIIGIVRQMCEKAGLADSMAYSSHSLRRGFASWANANQWDLKSLMEYVGWKDVQSAMRYIETPDPFAQHRIQQILDQDPPQILPEPPMATRLEIFFRLERFHSRVRNVSKTHNKIEQFCLSSHALEILKPDRSKYAITIAHESAQVLEERLDELLEHMHDIANDHHCMLDVLIEDPATGRTWS